MRAICIASGASLTKEDVEYCKGKGRVYVVNDCYRLAPWADVLYAADTQWWRYHKPDFNGEKWTVSFEAERELGITRIDYMNNKPWGGDDWIASGGNSGFQVMNLAELQGATEIILLGYDMGYTGKKHWFGEHPAKINTNSRYDVWIKNFARAKPHMKAKVINCTRETNLHCFEQARLEDIL